MAFDGETFEPDRDTERLSSLLERVKTLMLDGQWRSLSAISERVSAPEASVSARLRDLRKPKFGEYRVERRHVGDGLFQYKLLAPVPPLAPVAPEPPEQLDGKLFDPAPCRPGMFDPD